MREFGTDAVSTLRRAVKEREGLPIRTGPGQFNNVGHERPPSALPSADQINKVHDGSLSLRMLDGGAFGAARGCPSS